MKYLIDANVLSEATRSRPSPEVVEWLEVHEAELAVDAVVLGELAVGVESLPKGRKRTGLSTWLEALAETIECLPWDGVSAREWARLVAELRRRGQTMPLFDSTIAATARVHGLVIVTRNVRDFAPSGVELLNPFPDADQPDAVHEPGGGYGG